jgi:hypothetical protein
MKLYVNVFFTFQSLQNLPIAAPTNDGYLNFKCNLEFSKPQKIIAGLELCDKIYVECYPYQNFD